MARDCLTKALNPHWEGDRNDQCQACDAGGTLTECTRCNIVWHASCLQPPLPFPLRTQDAIVCGNACWAELTEELLTRGEPEPTQENPLHTPKLLPRRHSETTSTPHNYPSITTPTPQGDSASEPSTHDATTRGQKRKARGQRKGKRKQPRLSAHINPNQQQPEEKTVTKHTYSRYPTHSHNKYCNHSEAATVDKNHSSITVDYRHSRDCVFLTMSKETSLYLLHRRTVDRARSCTP